MRVLIVRLSSMGDLVQTLPALTDASRAIPNISFDWAVDESFAQIPAWHTHVDRVFPAALRRWGKDFRKALKSEELKPFLGQLRAREYDAVVDVQGVWKSATVSRLAKGERFGYDASSIHEWGAHLAYNRRLSVPKGQHSIARMRQLLARALNYEFVEKDLSYGFNRSRLPEVEIPSGAYVVLIHSTAWESKVWPEHYWRELARRLIDAGLRVVLPWGSDDERERAVRIADGNSSAEVLPKLSIADKATIISRAVATVGLDTGLSHIAAALGIPSLTIYGATDPLLVGATGENQLHLASQFECVKCHEVTCGYEKPSAFKPACFVEVTPDRVWDELTRLGLSLSE